MQTTAARNVDVFLLRDNQVPSEMVSSRSQTGMKIHRQPGYMLSYKLKKRRRFAF
jgi:hypothetical protein